MIDCMLILSVPLSNALAVPAGGMPEARTAGVAALAMPAGRRRRKADR
jgi:acid phosphatase family membrane protein YuiD